jgi:hypothetical protein
MGHRGVPKRVWAVLRRLQPVLRKGEWKVTVVLNKGNHDPRAADLDVHPGLL